MLLFTMAGGDWDMQQLWERYSGLTSEFMYDIAVHGNVLMRLDFRDGIFGTKIKLGVGWNVETGEKGFLSSVKLDKKQLAREAVRVSGDHKALLKAIHMAAGEYNLSDFELTQGVMQAAGRSDMPFQLRHVPLTRSLQVLDQNGNPSTLENLIAFLVKT